MFKVRQTLAAPLLLCAVFLLSLGIRLVPSRVYGGTDVYLAVSLLQLAVFAIPTAIFIALRGEGYSKKLRLRLPGRNHGLFIFCVFGVMTLTSMLINYGLYNAFPELFASSGAVSTESFSTSYGGAASILAFAILPALCEEVLFRSVILAEYEVTGVFGAVIFSSATFAMSHFSLPGLGVYLFCGVCLAFVVYVTRSVVSSCIVHVAYNIVTLFSDRLIYRIISRQGSVLFVFAAACTVLLLCVIGFGQAERIYTGYSANNVPSEHVLKRKERQSMILAFLSPPNLALCLLFILAVFFL